MQTHEKFTKSNTLKLFLSNYYFEFSNIHSLTDDSFEIRTPGHCASENERETSTYIHKI